MDINAVKKIYKDSKPDIVIHLAAVVGGIGANMSFESGLRNIIDWYRKITTI